MPMNVPGQVNPPPLSGLPPSLPSRPVVGGSGAGGLVSLYQKGKDAVTWYKRTFPSEETEAAVEATKNKLTEGKSVTAEELEQLEFHDEGFLKWWKEAQQIDANREEAQAKKAKKVSEDAALTAWLANPDEPANQAAMERHLPGTIESIANFERELAEAALKATENEWQQYMQQMSSVSFIIENAIARFDVEPQQNWLPLWKDLVAQRMESVETGSHKDLMETELRHIPKDEQGFPVLNQQTLPLLRGWMDSMDKVRRGVGRGLGDARAWAEQRNLRNAGQDLAARNLANTGKLGTDVDPDTGKAIVLDASGKPAQEVSNIMGGRGSAESQRGLQGSESMAKRFGWNIVEGEGGGLYIKGGEGGGQNAPTTATPKRDRGPIVEDLPRAFVGVDNETLLKRMSVALDNMKKRRGHVGKLVQGWTDTFVMGNHITEKEAKAMNEEFAQYIKTGDESVIKTQPELAQRIRNVVDNQKGRTPEGWIDRMLANLVTVGQLTQKQADANRKLLFEKYNLN